jgi:hypothetical protein
MSESPESPVTMPEGFTETKKKLKRRAVAWFAIYMLAWMSFWVFGSWVYGFGEPLHVRRLDELRVVTGEFYVRKYYKTKSPSFDSALRDPKTDNTIITTNDALCELEAIRPLFIGKPAKIWYADKGAGPIHFIYQLEVDGQLVCSLDKANERVPVLNARRNTFRPWFDIGVFVLFCTIAVLASYLDYRAKLKKFLEEQQQQTVK